MLATPSPTTTSAWGCCLATHGALALAGAGARQRSGQLADAVKTNRRIGMAIGIVMTQHKVTESQAGPCSTIASQNTNRKVRDIAEHIITTGMFPEAPHERRPPRSDANRT